MSKTEEARGSGDTLLRQWLMLLRIPADPARRSTSEIAAYLRDEGYEVTTRTVQRDLEKLSAVFGHTCLTEARTNYWYFPREQRVFELPGMNSATALALLLARDNANSMVPPATMDLLKPYFSRAEEVLAQAIPRPLSQWRKRIKVIQRGPILRPAAVRSGIQTVVYDAVLYQRQIKIRYKARHATAESPRTLHPMGIVLREGVLYLVATAGQDQSVKHYALHRMTEATTLDEQALVPNGFDLDSYVEQEFRYPTTPATFHLSLRIDKDAAYHLQERPLAKDQALTERPDYVELSATVPDTEELKWWILGFGERVEVMKPIKLRREIGSQIARLALKYKK